MGTYSSVDCCEEHGTPQEQWGEDEITCSVVLRCAWSNRYALVADILGNRNAWPYLAGPRAISAAIAWDEAAPVSVSGQTASYQDALVTVNYSTNAEEELVSESIEPTVEFLTHDYRRFRWASANGDPLLEGEAPGQQVKGLNLVRTYHKVETIPTAVLTLQGACNDAEYESDLLGLTFAAETLLFQPPNLSRSITTAGAKAWKLTLKFQYKPNGWNKFFRGKVQEWQEIFEVEGGEVVKPYPPEDFSALFS